MNLVYLISINVNNFNLNFINFFMIKVWSSFEREINSPIYTFDAYILQFSLIYQKVHG